MSYIKDLFLGTIFLLFGLIFVVVISNNICKLIEKFVKLPNIIILIIHLFIIIGLIIIFRTKLNIYILNKDVYTGVLTLSGPIVGATSLYIGPIIKKYGERFLLST
jgi:hypothetical protein